MAIQTPLYIQGLQHKARVDRQLIEHQVQGEGVATFNDFRVTTNNSGLQILVASGHGWVRGDTNAFQGLYKVHNDANVILTHATAHATLQRNDLVIVRINDTIEGTGATDTASIEIVQGTPGAGTPALPLNCMFLAEVIITAALTGPIPSANITDRRLMPVFGTCAGMTHVVDGVHPVPVGTGNHSTAFTGFLTTTHNNMQIAGHFTLPRGIQNAARIRWAYQQQNTTALTGNFIMGIYDASGRFIIGTAATAFIGAALSFTATNVALTSTVNLPAGEYYMLLGLASLVGGQVQFDAMYVGNYGGSLPRTDFPVRNGYLISATGGTTAPTTLLAFTDKLSDFANDRPSLPRFAITA